MSTTLAECTPVECEGCGATLPAGETTLRDGERYCPPCLAEVEDAAQAQHDEDWATYNRVIAEGLHR